MTIKVYSNGMGGIYFSSTETGHTSYIDDEGTVVCADNPAELIPDDAELIAEIDGEQVVVAAKIAAGGLSSLIPLKEEN